MTYLNNLKSGEYGIIVQYDGDFRQRVYEMGLPPGQKFTVFSSSQNGGTIVSVPEASIKYAVDRTLASKLKVKHCKRPTQVQSNS